MEENMTDEQFKQLGILFGEYLNSNDIFRGYHYGEEYYFSCGVINFIAENLEEISKVAQRT